MAVLTRQVRAYIRESERNCQARGYVKCGANFYRIHGQDLLQTVTFHGIPGRTTDEKASFQPSVAFAVHSLYASIFWINIPVERARHDLMPNILPSTLVDNADGKAFLGTGHEAVCMNDAGLPFLDETVTHAQLAQFLEEKNRQEEGHIHMNDGNKVVPYLLSGRRQDAMNVIDAIEKQNQQAYMHNCKMSNGYDPVLQKQKMDAKLAPLRCLRENIETQNRQGILDYLLANYQENLHRLEAMGVTVPDRHLTDQELLDLIFP